MGIHSSIYLIEKSISRIESFVVFSNNCIYGRILFMLEPRKFKLKVNDEDVPCKDFVQEIISNGLYGMISTLRTDQDEIKRIKIEVRFD